MAGVLVVAVLAALFHAKKASSTPIIPRDSTEYRHPPNGICTDYTISEDVASTNYIWDLPKLQNNYDVVNLLTNIARKDSAEVFHPFSGTQNMTNTYVVSATFCSPKLQNGKEETVLLATHGLGYDRRYWASSHEPSNYSFVDYALDKGYSVFYYDRLGTGKSETLSGYVNQASIQLDMLEKLTQSIRAGKYTSNTTASKIVLVGHSFGSQLSNVLIATKPDLADAAVLTGIAYPNATDLAAADFQWIPEAFAARIASTLPTSPFPDLDTGYVAFGDIYAHINTFFKAPAYDIPTAEYAQSIAQPLAIAEFLAPVGNKNASAFRGPVFVTTGENDLIACGGQCRDTFANGRAEREFFQGAYQEGRLGLYIHPGVGHGANFGFNATGFYGEILGFLDRML